MMSVSVGDGWRVWRVMCACGGMFCVIHALCDVCDRSVMCVSTCVSVWCVCLCVSVWPWYVHDVYVCVCICVTYLCHVYNACDVGVSMCGGIFWICNTWCVWCVMPVSVCDMCVYGLCVCVWRVSICDMCVYRWCVCVWRVSVCDICVCVYLCDVSLCIVLSWVCNICEVCVCVWGDALCG